MPVGLKRASSTILLAAAMTFFAGCDNGQNRADNEVREDLKQAHQAAAEGNSVEVLKGLNKAAGNQTASAAMRAGAKAELAQAELEAAQAILNNVDRTELEISRVGWEITQLGYQIQAGSSAISGYRKFDPQAIRQEIAAKIADAQGGPAKTAWFTFGSSTIPTLTAAKAEVLRIQGELSQREEKVKGLNERRGGLITQAEQSFAQADKLSGAASVEAFKKSSDLRRQAGELSIEIAGVQNEIGLRQNNLAVAQGQQKAVEDVIKQLQEQSTTLDQAWKEMDTQVTAQQQLAGKILGSDSEGNSTISAKAAELARLVEKAQGYRKHARENLGKAVTHFDGAYKAAQELYAQLQNQITDQKNAGRPELEAWKNMQELMQPMQFKLRQSSALRSLAGLNATEARSLATRISVKTTASGALGALGLTVPAGIIGGDLPTDLKNALDAAEKQYTDAGNLLKSIIEGRSSQDLITAAHVARALSLYSLSQVQGQLGKDASRTMSEAIGERDAAFARTPAAVPQMPDAFGSPPKSATENPPPAGATTDEAAVRAVAVAFADAIENADNTAAKAMAQIEPGQEQFFDELVKTIAEFGRFERAMVAKFGAQSVSKEKVDGPGFMLRTKPVTVKGDDAFIVGGPDANGHGDAIRVNGVWKMYFGPAASESAQAERQTIIKIGTALTQLTADVEGGKYANAEAAMSAFSAALMSQTMPGMPPAPGGGAPATPRSATPATPATPGRGAAPAPAGGAAGVLSIPLPPAKSAGETAVADAIRQTAGLEIKTTANADQELAVREDDQAAVSEILKKAAKEARAWLGEPNHAGGQIAPDALNYATELLYAAGAKSVYFGNIEQTAEKAIAGSMIVELPTNTAQRMDCIRIVAGMSRLAKSRFGGIDIGQKYAMFHLNF